mmetsp:Transcript_35293/g.101684  ORF Transcript_35293/g.101684 Transcript_35293/m.101684 type:complete len:232 (+) Transcript_35293:1265-1960(+)
MTVSVSESLQRTGEGSCLSNTISLIAAFRSLSFLLQKPCLNPRQVFLCWVFLGRSLEKNYRLAINWEAAGIDYARLSRCLFCDVWNPWKDPGQATMNPCSTDWHLSSCLDDYRLHTIHLSMKLLSVYKMMTICNHSSRDSQSGWDCALEARTPESVSLTKDGLQPKSPADLWALLNKLRTSRNMVYFLSIFAIPCFRSWYFKRRLAVAMQHSPMQFPMPRWRCMLLVIHFP